jgi:hypothetical protein
MTNDWELVGAPVGAEHKTVKFPPQRIMPDSYGNPQVILQPDRFKGIEIRLKTLNYTSDELEELAAALLKVAQMARGE